ncbi:hypothetical protein [Cocleimonas flava]|uniref:hypothetical protein n=1 Tax=Cocleimonas flava TaxID=634765 RepID=UPI00104E8257|nr:hypothetical protein [Cocleimonas flava]
MVTLKTAFLCVLSAGFLFFLYCFSVISSFDGESVYRRIFGVKLADDLDDLDDFSDVELR